MKEANQAIRRMLRTLPSGVPPVRTSALNPSLQNMGKKGKRTKHKEKETPTGTPDTKVSVKEAETHPDAESLPELFAADKMDEQRLQQAVEDFETITSGAERRRIVEAIRDNEQSFRGVCNYMRREDAGRSDDSVCRLLYTSFSKGKSSERVAALAFIPCLLWLYYTRKAYLVGVEGVETLFAAIYNTSQSLTPLVSNSRALTDRSFASVYFSVSDTVVKSGGGGNTPQLSVSIGPDLTAAALQVHDIDNEKAKNVRTLDDSNRDDVLSGVARVYVEQFFSSSLLSRRLFCAVVYRLMSLGHVLPDELKATCASLSECNALLASLPVVKADDASRVISAEHVHNDVVRVNLPPSVQGQLLIGVQHALRDDESVGEVATYAHAMCHYRSRLDSDASMWLCSSLAN